MNHEIFQHMPNLRYLTLETYDLCLDEYTCETIITDYLSHIKTFQLKMNFEFYSSLTNTNDLFDCDWDHFLQKVISILYYMLLNALNFPNLTDGDLNQLVQIVESIGHMIIVWKMIYFYLLFGFQIFIIWKLFFLWIKNFNSSFQYLIIWFH